MAVREDTVKDRARLRKMAGLTQMQLGRKVGKSAGTICLWERGEIELTPGDIERIARALEGELARQPAVSNATQIAGMLTMPLLAAPVNA
jgi:transcriptional regulator with XRE-family HTH domain